MKSVIITITAFLLFSLLSCDHKKQGEAFTVFNDGVTLNLQAIEEQNRGNLEKAAALNKQSIDKFKETLRLDSTHPLARSSLAHCLYIDRQFQEAIHWFEQANKINGDAASNFREIGLCKINAGQIQAGKSAIDKAFSLDTTKEIREITIRDLEDIGEQAFSYADGYTQQGEIDKGKAYKTFSIGVLILAFEYDKSNKGIALKISNYANKLGDRETANRYKIYARTIN